MYLTVDEAAQHFRCSRDVIIRRCKEGVLPNVNIGTAKKPRYRILAKDLPCMIRSANGVKSKLVPKMRHF